MAAQIRCYRIECASEMDWVLMDGMWIPPAHGVEGPLPSLTILAMAGLLPWWPNMPFAPHTS